MDTVNIKFPENINATQFEHLLAEHYAKSRRINVKNVLFDFSLVSWCGLFELSLITIWIATLISQNKRIKFTYPKCSYTETELKTGRLDRLGKRALVCAFLNRWDFDDFLNENEVEIVGHLQDYPLWSSNSEQDAILPLKLFNKFSEFGAFEDYLHESKQFSLIFKDVMSLSVIGHGGIRDTIIREIGQNIYDHTKGNFGLITMGKMSKLTNNLAYEARTNSAFPLEKSFFETLRGSGYLQVIIADNGDGIFSSLKSNYFENSKNSHTNKKRSDYEHKVLDYAFEFDTTSKSERKIEIEEGQGRGLYWVKELVRENKGLLSIRSGSSIITYDFLNDPDRHKYYANRNHKNLRSLANFGGTQIKIYFPLDPDLVRKGKFFQSALPFNINDKTNHQYKVIEVRIFLDESNKWSTRETNKVIENLLPRKTEGDGLSISIIDFAETIWSKDDIYPLLMRLAQSQHDDRVVVIVNIQDVDIFNIASNILRTKIEENPQKIKPIPFLVGDKIQILGLSFNDEKFLAPDLSQRNSLEDIEYFCQRNEHIFSFDPFSKSIVSRLNIEQIKKERELYYKQTISDYIFDYSNETCFRGKFLIPSNVYADTYFRVTTLLSDNTITERVLYVFYNSISQLEIKPDYLVTIANEVKGIGATLSDILSNQWNKKVEHINLPDIKDENRAIATLIDLRSKYAVVLCNVVGTGDSLSAVLDICQEKGINIKVLGLLCIIDAREYKKFDDQIDKSFSEFEHSSINYPLYSVISHPLTFHSTRPTDWRVEDILQIDPETNAPETKDPLPPATKPIFEDVDQYFLGNIVRNSNAISIGHYLRNQRHYVHYFDIIQIANHFGSDIANKIKKDVDGACKNLNENLSSIVCVLYDEQSRGAKTMAELIGKELSTEVLSIQELKVSAVETQRKIHKKNLVIYESAISSGRHLQSLVDGAAKYEPKNIFAYSITQRRESDDIRFFQKIDNYFGVMLRVRCFAEIEIPPYNDWNCPVCHRFNELRSLKEIYNDIFIGEFINSELNKLQLERISWDNSFDKVNQVDIDEAISQVILRRKLGAAKTNYLIRKEVTKIIEDESNPNNSFRLLSVISKEISLLSTYKELFYEGFCNKLGEYCLHVLQNSVGTNLTDNAPLIVLRHLTPKLFISNAPYIFKLTAYNNYLLTSFFIEFLILLKSKQIETTTFINALTLCQRAFEEDSQFHNLSVEDIFKVQHLLTYIRKSLSNEEYKEDSEKRDEPWKALKHLWHSFVGDEERVHPKLAQGISDITGITSKQGFEQALEKYFGEGEFADLSEQLILSFEQFPDCLRDSSRSRLSYFLEKGNNTFSNDLKILDRNIRFLAVLRNQGRLTDEDVERYLRHPSVISASQRLNTAFARDNSVSAILKKKFTQLKPLIDNIVEIWKPRFEKLNISLEANTKQDDVFIPSDVLEDILTGLLQNISEHAFSPDTPDKKGKIEIYHQELGKIVVSVLDSGKGITEENLAERQNGGLRKSEKLLSLYGGSLNIETRLEQQDYTTSISLTLLLKEQLFL